MNEDKFSIKLLCQEKGWDAKRICKEFSNKKWAVSSVRDLLGKTDTTNLISQKAGSGQPRTVRTEQNIERVAELMDAVRKTTLSPAEVPEILKS